MDWKESFNPLAVRVGQALYANGAVRHLARRGNLFTADVLTPKGVHPVRIRIENDTITSVVCDGEENNLTPASAAVLLALEHADWDELPDSEIPVRENRPGPEEDPRLQALEKLLAERRSRKEQEPAFSEEERQTPAQDALSKDESEESAQPERPEKVQEETLETGQEESLEPQPSAAGQDPAAQAETKAAGENTAPAKSSVKTPFIPRSSLQMLEEKIRTCSQSQLADLLCSLLHSNPQLRDQIFLQLQGLDPEALLESICTQTDHILFGHSSADPAAALADLLHGPALYLSTLDLSLAWQAVRYIADSALEARLLLENSGGLSLIQSVDSLLKLFFEKAPLSLRREIMDWIADFAVRLPESLSEILAQNILSPDKPDLYAAQRAWLESVYSRTDLPCETRSSAADRLDELMHVYGMEEDLEDFYAKHHEDPHIRLLQVQNLLRAQDLDGAVDLLEENLRMDERHHAQSERWMRMLADVYLHSGHNEDAARVLHLLIDGSSRAGSRDLLALHQAEGEERFEQSLQKIVPHLSMTARKEMYASLGRNEELMDLLEEDLYEYDLRRYETQLAGQYADRLAGVWIALGNQRAALASSRSGFEKAADCLRHAKALNPASQDIESTIEKWRQEYGRHHTFMRILDDLEKELHEGGE